MHSPFQQIIAVLCFSFLLLADNSSAADTALKLKSVSDKLYQFSNGEGDSGVLLITSQGAIIGDPLDEITALALQAQLEARFESKAKYVFYTRADVSRAGGAKVFADSGALVIAQANALQNAAVIDGLVSSPDLVFTASMSVRLGDQSVTLQHLGNNVSDHTLVARFAWQKAVFAADFVAIESLPTLALDQGYYPDWFSALDRLSRLDYQYLLDGQGNIGNRNDARQFEYYLRELHNRVKRALDSGQTEEQVLTTVKMRKYRDWRHYSEQLSANVASMFRALQR